MSEVTRASSTERGTMSRRRFLRMGCGALVGGGAATLAGAGYATQVEPRWIDVTRPEVSLPGWPEALDGFTVAQLSDLHVGPYVGAAHVRRAVEAVNALEPDLAVITGDFVYRSAGYSVACARELAALEAPHGVYAVLGNHDVWTDADQVARELVEAGIVVLRNDLSAGAQAGRRGLEVRDTRLWLLGIEDAGYTGFTGLASSSFTDFRAMWQEAAHALSELLEGIPEEAPRLLLAHNPDFTEMLPEGRIDLALCGHTHGGQVRLPFIGAPLVPSCFGGKYAAGLIEAPRTKVYVNRGIGLIGLPVRFNCRPEVTLLRLKHAGEGASANG